MTDVELLSVAEADGVPADTAADRAARLGGRVDALLAAGQSADLCDVVAAAFAGLRSSLMDQRLRSIGA